ncbi:MAG: hypothetical protein ACK5HU_04460 [Flavobacteriales bacterium]
MNKNPMMTGFVIAILVVVFSYGISKLMNQKKLEFIIDNPTSEKIQVQIDEQHYEIAAKSFKKIELEKGDHLLNGKHSFTYDFIHHGVINPTKSTYYLYKRFYGSVAKKDSIFQHAPFLKVNKKKYLFTDTISAYFIQDFYYNLNEDFPNWTNSQKDSLKIDARKKIFRKEDFENFYKKEND